MSTIDVLGIDITSGSLHRYKANDTVSGIELSANKGVANGYASLDATSKVPAANLPSYVDDVLEFTNLAGFPATGTTGIIYVALDTNKTYRWSGTTYVEISPSDVNSVNGRTGAVTGLQEGDATLNSLAAYNTNGLLTQTAADTFAGRTLTGTVNQVTVTNGDGVAGNPTLTTPQDIATTSSPTFANETISTKLTLSDTSGATTGGIIFATDVNLYRSAADTLRTDDNLFISVGNVQGLTVQSTNSPYIRIYSTAGTSLNWAFVSQFNGAFFELLRSTTAGGVPNTTVLKVNASGDVGIGVSGSITPNSKLTVAGPIATALSTKTAAYTITATDSVILADATTAAFTVTLPSAVGITGRQYTLKKIDSSLNAITLAAAGAETIDGAATYALGTQWKYVKITSNGAAWFVTGNN